MNLETVIANIDASDFTCHISRYRHMVTHTGEVGWVWDVSLSLRVDDQHRTVEKESFSVQGSGPSLAVALEDLFNKAQAISHLSTLDFNIPF